MDIAGMSLADIIDGAINKMKSCGTYPKKLCLSSKALKELSAANKIRYKNNGTPYYRDILVIAEKLPPGVKYGLFSNAPESEEE